MAFAGLRGTGDFATDERPKNFREYILWRNPNGKAPLTALMAKMKSEKTDDAEYSWWQEALNIVRMTLNGVMNTTTTTSFVVDSGALALVPGDVLMIETSDVGTVERVEVANVTSDTAFDVTRGASGTTAAAIPDGTGILRIGTVFSEGASSPDVSSNNPTKLYNYCQIFKTAYELTESAKATRTRTGDPLKNDKRRKMFDHSVSMELAFMFGNRHETTGTNGKPKRFTGGLRNFISTNVTIFSTSPTEDTFINAVAPVFDYDTGAGDERLVMAGNGFMMNLNKLAKTNTQIQADGIVEVYGMRLQRWVLPQGTFYFKTHPLMNAHATYKNSAFILDPDALVYRYLNGRDTAAQDKIQNNDEDTHKGQWLTEAGIEYHHEETMAYIGNFVI